jgi:hypothetical protein
MDPMTQSASRPSTINQAAPGAATQPADATAPAKAGALSLGWRITLYLWVAAFLGLVLFELLNTLVRVIAKWM